MGLKLSLTCQQCGAIIRSIRLFLGVSGNVKLCEVLLSACLYRFAPIFDVCSIKCDHFATEIFDERRKFAKLPMKYLNTRRILILYAAQQGEISAPFFGCILDPGKWR
jgi:hypothetical protein